jgi:hypothetical protein
MDEIKAAKDSAPEQKLVSRRALMRAGWIVPVIMAVGIPRDALYAEGSDGQGGGGGGGGGGTET